MLISFSIPTWLLWVAGSFFGAILLLLAGFGVVVLWVIGTMKGGFWR